MVIVSHLLPASVLTEPVADSIGILPVRDRDLTVWQQTASAAAQNWVRSTGFNADPGEVALLPGPDGALAQVLIGTGPELGLWCLAGLPEKLPRGTYHLQGALTEAEATRAATGWALGNYRFTRYRSAETDKARLVLPAGADAATVTRVVAAVTLVRDMVNTPAEHMGPAEIVAVAEGLAVSHAARLTVIEGEALLEANYPLIHAVGRAAVQAPRLIDLQWQAAETPADAPLVVLVGKGVCFDSGGLDIKSAAGMLMMKKDMGGAAHALALAQMVMQAGLPVRLRVLVPAVENAIAGNAFRPMDIFRSRKGLTVEIGNTDAEGRLVLCDALAEADSQQPALLIDFATLTGAARVALGPELPAMFSNNDALASELMAAGAELGDPLWRLPLWAPYRRMLDSKMANINNSSNSTFAGSITAALFLQDFVSRETCWAHFDLYAWNSGSRPGRPEGGEAMTLRAVFAVLSRRFGTGAGII
jgi:leucyl aminopeptidase